MGISVESMGIHGIHGIHLLSTISSSNWNLEMLVFVEGGKPWEQGREPTTNSTHKLTPSPGIEPGPHWWEASALTTVSSLLPKSFNQGPVVQSPIKLILD